MKTKKAKETKIPIQSVTITRRDGERMTVDDICRLVVIATAQGYKATVTQEDK